MVHFWPVSYQQLCFHKTLGSWCLGTDLGITGKNKAPRKRDRVSRGGKYKTAHRM